MDMKFDIFMHFVKDVHEKKSMYDSDHDQKRKTITPVIEKKNPSFMEKASVINCYVTTYGNDKVIFISL